MLNQIDLLPPQAVGGLTAAKRQEAHRHQPPDSRHSHPGSLERKRSSGDPDAGPNHARPDVAFESFRGANPGMVPVAGVHVPSMNFRF